MNLNGLTSGGKDRMAKPSRMAKKRPEMAFPEAGTVRSEYGAHRYRLTIPGRLPGLNEIIHEGNRHWAKGASLKKTETQRCMEYILLYRIPVFTRPITVNFKWIEPNKRRDRDNIQSGQKFFLDALVEMGKIPNDGPKWVVGTSHEFPEPDLENPRIEIEILEFR